MLWDIYQQSRIESNTDNIRRVDRKRESGDETLETRLQRTTDRLEALMVACQAMWEILRDDAGVGEQKLLAKIEEVDMRSGEQNGKMPKKIVHCKCGRANNPRHKLCLYCGDYLNKSDDPHVFHIP